MNIANFLSEYPILITLQQLAGEQGSGIYLVGGFIRDLLIDRKRKKKEMDFLVVGNALGLAESLCTKVGGSGLTTFKNFGTAHFKLDDWHFEFVAARRESYAKHSRNPKVTSGTFEDDIMRRDFTVNALAVNLEESSFGEIIDLTDGLSDIERKLLRTPLDPEKTFDDDPLRIMRAFRFASEIDFAPVPEIMPAANSMRERLQIVAQERITDEFLKILASPKPDVGLILLYRTQVMEVIFPEVARLGGVDQRSEYHHKDVFYHTCEVVKNISETTEDVWLRFAALMHDIAKPPTKRLVPGVGWTFHGHEELGARMMKRIFERLKLPFQKLEYVEKLVRLHLRPMALAEENVTDSAVRRLIVDAGEDLGDLILLCRADITSKNAEKVNRYLENYDRVMERVLEVREKDRLRAFQSPVRGDIIMKELNLQPGKSVGIIKKGIEEAILDGRIPNEYEAAFTFMIENKDKLLSEANKG